ncbi:MFS transporter [Heyndrickxia acidicola]|uniref:MFS transporter n=1 Tax=Heyndrickxia acidicola TaxID=209389 RepID=A0ABU6MFR1_9BACI|nr:MFS transporter [Heyndrickxia acidicola]MED1203244.1 MFS transporter [Heyndrickxia acidicola]
MKQFAITSYVMYFLGGCVLTIVGSVLPQILAHYELTYTVGGQLVFLGSLGFLLGVPISTYMLGRISEKNLLALAAAFIAVAQIGMYFLPPFQWIIFFNFLNGIGVAALEMVVATLMMELFVGRRAVVMSYLEVSFGVGALFMPLAASFFINQQHWRASFLLTSILAVVMVAVSKAIRFNKHDAHEEDASAKPSDASSAVPPVLPAQSRWKVLILFVLMIFMYAGVESSLNNFLSSIFITYLKAIPSFASLSIGTFWVAMLAGRIATGWIIRKVTYERYLLFSIIGAIFSLVLFILFKNMLAGYLLLLVLGLAMSGIYSITMVYANHTLSGLSARIVTGFITGFSGLGGAVFPAVIGFAMDRAGIGPALWVIAGFGVMYLAALTGVLVFRASVHRAHSLHSQG